jgi:hypothetical protein
VPSPTLIVVWNGPAALPLVTVSGPSTVAETPASQEVDALTVTSRFLSPAMIAAASVEESTLVVCTVPPVREASVSTQPIPAPPGVRPMTVILAACSASPTAAGSATSPGQCTSPFVSALV